MYKDNYYEDDDEEDREDRERMFDLQDLFGEMSDIGYSSDINKAVLNLALKFLESSFWWRFRSHTARMRLFLNTYNQFQEMLSSNPNYWDETGEDEDEDEEEVEDGV